MIQPQVFIELTSAYEAANQRKYRVNVAHISAIIDHTPKPKEYGAESRANAVVTGFSNNGGAYVIESPEEIMKKIRLAESLVQSKMIDDMVLVEKRVSREAPARRTIQM